MQTAPTLEKSNTTQNSVLPSKLVHLALPVRWSLVGDEDRGPAEMGCTYDIHPRGARLLSTRPVRVGDLVMMERGRNKAVCQVVWTADFDSPLRGQFTVRCVENVRVPWDDELRQMAEEYQPMILDGLQQRGLVASRSDQNRRRRPRFSVAGQAAVSNGSQRADGTVHQISEFGARITAPDALRPGTDFSLMLNVLDVRLALKARVKNIVANAGMGVEFQEIRRGDRPLLTYVLEKLRTRKVEGFGPVEVVMEPQMAAG